MSDHSLDLSMRPPLVIGLHGDPGAGKDQFAEFLVEDHGFVRFAFADRLRECCAALDPIVGWRPTMGQCNCMCHTSDSVKHAVACCYPTLGGPVRWTEAMAEGYAMAKLKYPEIRDVQRRLGTEVVRDMVNPNYWVDYVYEQAIANNTKPIVITDVRFVNEAEMIVDGLDGFVVKVMRPGTKGSDHRSDNDLADWPFHSVVHNDGTLGDLRLLANPLLHTLTSRQPMGMEPSSW